MTDERLPALAIGAVMGDSDPESMTWLAAIRQLTREARAASPDDYDGIIVNVAFHVDGTVLPLDFTGVRTGSYRKAKKLLEVQVAVAKDPVPDRRQLLLELVVAAVDEAETLLIRRKVVTGLSEIQQVVAAMRGVDRPL